MRVVLDTNVLISDIFWNGTPKEILTIAVKQEFTIYATEVILCEYFRIIEKISKKNNSLIHQWKMMLLDLVHLIEPVKNIKVCRDPKGDIFLACALAAAAKIIVSGDDDLLVLHPWNNIDILKPLDFLKLLRPTNN